MIYSDGDVYEGGWETGKWHGRGEYEDCFGAREVGNWVNNCKQGEFKCYDEDGYLTYKVYRDNEEVHEMRNSIYKQRINFYSSP